MVRRVKGRQGEQNVGRRGSDDEAETVVEGKLKKIPEEWLRNVIID